MMLDSFSEYSVKTGTVVRLMSPLGLYWKGAFESSSAVYSASKQLVFTACHFDRNAHDPDDYTEFDDPMVEEIRLQSALSLAIGWDGGMVSLYPHCRKFISPDRPTLNDPCVLKELLDDALAHWSYQRQLMIAEPPPPPLLGGNEYSFRNSPLPTELWNNLYEKFNLDDVVLVRGLSSWLKAAALRIHPQFGEQSIMALYVSLDASFSAVLNRLRARGVSNPSAENASEFMETLIGLELSGTKYFEDYYLDRIRVLHPENRIRPTKYAPISNCDGYTLSEELREVYRSLILGEHVDPQNFISLD